MAYVLITHDVEDYDAWKVIFDLAEPIRKEAGEISYQVLRYEREPKKIVHFSRWSSLSNAKSFFESPEIIKIREQAGVKTPEFIYLNELQNGVL
jgi:quinol monooxygenase YgiN